MPCEDACINSGLLRTKRDWLSCSVGDRQGYAYLLDVIDPDRSSGGSHYLIPRAIKSRRPEDVAYLQSKGVFSLPAENICEALLQSYFHHVHPFSPVVDAKTVLVHYVKNGPKKNNLLLLWSMFSVASNVSDNGLGQWI